MKSFCVAFAVALPAGCSLSTLALRGERARLNEHPELEKLRGTITMGIGGSSLLTRMWSGQSMEPGIADAHWDFVVMRPTIALDGNVACKDGVMPEFKG